MWGSLKDLESVFVAPIEVSLETVSISDENDKSSEFEALIESQRKLVSNRIEQSERATRTRQNEYFRKALLNLHSSVMSK